MLRGNVRCTCPAVIDYILTETRRAFFAITTNKADREAFVDARMELTGAKTIKYRAA